MIQTKIFSTLEIAKKIDSFKPGYKEQAVQQILNDIKLDHTNINDAFVILEFIKSVSEQVLESIHGETVENVINNGDNEALGVQLVVEKIKEYDYSEDKEWSNINKTVSVYTDALKKREKTLQDSIKQALVENKKPEIQFTYSYKLVPRLAGQ